MATKTKQEEPKLTMAEIAKLFDEKLKEAKQGWEEEYKARTAEEKAKAQAEVEANAETSLADDIANMKEASKSTCLLRGPFQGQVEMNGLRYWVNIPGDEEQEVPQWVAYIINQSRQAEAEVAKKISGGGYNPFGGQGAVWGA